MKKNLLSIWSIFVLVVLGMQACGTKPAAPQPTATATATFVPSATSTLTSTPSRTPRPSRTPNATKTHNYEDIFSHVQTFKDEGLIPSTDGKLMPVVGFDDHFAQMGWLYPTSLHYI